MISSGRSRTVVDGLVHRALHAPLAPAAVVATAATVVAAPAVLTAGRAGVAVGSSVTLAPPLTGLAGLPGLPSRTRPVGRSARGVPSLDAGCPMRAT